VWGGNGALINSGSAATYAGVVTIGTGGATIGAGDITLGAALAPGANALTKTGAGTLALTTNSTRSGTTTLTNLNTFNVTTSGIDLTLGGLVTGTGGLRKIGAVTMYLSVANDYKGGTEVAEGTLRVRTAGGLGSGVATVGSASGGTLVLEHGAAGGTWGTGNTITLTALGTLSAVVDEVATGNPPNVNQIDATVNIEAESTATTLQAERGVNSERHVRLDVLRCRRPDARQVLRRRQGHLHLHVHARRRAGHADGLQRPR